LSAVFWKKEKNRLILEAIFLLHFLVHKLKIDARPAQRGAQKNASNLYQ